MQSWQWSLSCVRDRPMLWLWVLWYYRMTQVTWSLSKESCGPVLLFIILSAALCRNVGGIVRVGDRSWGWPEGSIFNSYYTVVKGRALLLSLDCSTLPLILTLLCWELDIEASTTIFKVWRNLGLNPCLPDHWQTLHQLGQWASSERWY